jgi:hypothetical protein
MLADLMVFSRTIIYKQGKEGRHHFYNQHFHTAQSDGLYVSYDDA